MKQEAFYQCLYSNSELQQLIQYHFYKGLKA